MRERLVLEQRLLVCIELGQEIDVVVKGASMSQTLRSDFGSIIRQKGGRVSGLLEELRVKTASLKADAGN